MQQQLALKDASVEVALAEWRRKAANALMVASTIVYLPVAIMFAVGQGPPVTWLVRLIAVLGYGVVLVDTLLWSVDYRARAWINLTTAYVLAVVGVIAVPQGPFVRTIPVVIPFTAIVFFGKRAGRIAAGISILVLLFVPPMSTLPSLLGILTTEQTRASALPHVIWFQGIAMTAILLGTMVLLDRFHDFLMRSLTDRIAAYQKLQDEVRERRRLEDEVARATDEERRRLGQEIHDGVCQQLTAALLRTEALTRWIDPAQPAAEKELSELSAVLEETIEEARAVAHGLCPLDSDADALAAALRALADRVQNASGIACAFEPAGDVAVADKAMANHLYRIAQEAVANAVKHAHATKISVTLRKGEVGLLLEVEDDGRGLPGTNDGSGMGLRIMSHRAQMINGNLTVTAGATGGTRVSCRIPRDMIAASQPAVTEYQRIGSCELSL